MVYNFTRDGVIGVVVPSAVVPTALLVFRCFLLRSGGKLIMNVLFILHLTLLIAGILTLTRLIDTAATVKQGQMSLRLHSISTFALLTVALWNIKLCIASALWPVARIYDFQGMFLSAATIWTAALVQFLMSWPFNDTGFFIFRFSYGSAIEFLTEVLNYFLFVYIVRSPRRPPTTKSWALCCLPILGWPFSLLRIGFIARSLQDRSATLQTLQTHFLTWLVLQNVALAIAAHLIGFLTRPSRATTGVLKSRSSSARGTGLLSRFSNNTTPRPPNNSQPPPERSLSDPMEPALPPHRVAALSTPSSSTNLNLAPRDVPPRNLAADGNNAHLMHSLALPALASAPPTGPLPALPLENATNPSLGWHPQWGPSPNGSRPRHIRCGSEYSHRCNHKTLLPPPPLRSRQQTLRLVTNLAPVDEAVTSAREDPPGTLAERRGRKVPEIGTHISGQLKGRTVATSKPSKEQEGDWKKGASGVDMEPIAL